MYRLSEELTIEEINDSEKILIKKAQQVAFKEEYLALNNGNLFQLVVNFLDCVQNLMKMD